MLKKIFIAIGIIVSLFIAAAIIIPVVFKDKIIEMVKTSANENLNATLNFSDLDISLFRSFPNLSISISDLSIIGKEEFKNDSLVYIKTFDAGVNLWKIISGSDVEIKSVTLNQPLINLIGLKDGKVNWDIAKPSKEEATTASEPSAFNVALKKYAIENGNIRYRDDAMNFTMNLEQVNHTGKGDFTQDLFVLNTVTDIAKANTSYGGVSYLYNAKTNLKADLEMDMKNSKYTFKENQLTLNDMIVKVDGWLSMPANDINMDLKFSTPQNDFKSFMSLIPGVYRDGFKDVKSSGTMAFNGFVKGTYNETTMPGFGLNLKVDNGKFQYPSLPTPLNNVNINLKINNPSGVPDHTTINLSTLHVELGTEPFDARLNVKTPVSNAQFDGMVKGKINLDNIKNFVPLEAGTTMSGLIVSDLTFAGNMKAIEAEQYENINAAGNFELSRFIYKSNSYPKGVNMPVFSLTFNPRNITLNNMVASMGNSDVQAKGNLENVIPFYFKKNQLIKGSLAITSRQIDLNEFMSGASTTTTTAPDTSKMTVLEIPEYIDFTMTANVGKLLYENKVFTNINGNISMRDKTLGLNDISLNTLDGKVSINGVYHTKDAKNPFFNLDLALAAMDIQQTVKTFSTVEKMSPIAKRANGKYSTEFTVKGNMDTHMQPVLSSLNGGGKLSTQAVTVTNFEPLNKLADAIKMQQYKQLALNNVNISFEFKEGRVFVKPFETSLAGTKSKIEGSNGFDQTIDYNVNLAIPKAMLGSGATSVVTGLMGKLNSAVGTNLSVPDPVNIKINLGGLVNNPTVKTSVADAGKSVVNDVKAKAEEEAKKKIDEAKQKAQAEIDKAKKEAEDKVKAEAAKAKKDAEEKLKKEAKDKLKGIFGK